MIEYGADVNARDKNGRTPVDLAENRPDMQDFLREYGALTGAEVRADQRDDGYDWYNQ
jgi:ankyrin repeat protein